MDETTAFPYDEAEGKPASDVTLAQWARAQALAAIYARPGGNQGLRQVADQVNILAELIVSGGLPKPPPGITY